MDSTRERAAWVQRVLGVALRDAAPDPGRSAPPQGPAAELLAELMAAKEAVDAGLGKLAGVLRRTGDPDMERIADFGLFGLDGGGAVPLIAALMDARAAPPQTQAKLLDKACKAATAWRQTVLSDQTTALIDNNPFGVAVGLRTTLVQALARIENAA